MPDTTEREQIVAWLRARADMVDDLERFAYETAAECIERGDHLKESPHG